MTTLAAPSRRRFLFGAAAVLASPAIVRVAQLMPISVPKQTITVRLRGVPIEYDDRPRVFFVGRDFLAAYETEMRRLDDGTYKATVPADCCYNQIEVRTQRAVPAGRTVTIDLV